MRKKKPDYDNLKNRLMSEIGLDIDKDNYIIDQDSCSKVFFNQKALRVVDDPTQRMPRGETPFDPINNPKLMNNLFSHYNSKLEEDGDSSISIFYAVNPDTNGRSVVEAKNTENELYKSKPYINDSLKMMDIVFQLAGDTNVDLSEYDLDKLPKPKPRKK